MKAKPQGIPLTNKQREALNRQIMAEMTAYIEKLEKDFDIVMMYTLNQHFGFGRKRIKEFYHHCISDRLELRRFYDDDEHKVDSKIDIFAMEKALERKGICMREIIDEVFKERAEDVDELNGSRGKGV